MFTHSIHAVLVAVLMLGATLLASPVHAQEVAAAEVDNLVVQTSGPEATSAFTVYGIPAPDFSADQADFVRTGQVDPLDLDQSNSMNAGPNVALMVVGGAALVTGLIIGGDAGTVVAITGGVIGLVGLYRFMR